MIGFMNKSARKNKMKKTIFMLSAALFALGAVGAVYTGIETDVSALPKEKAFIGQMVRSRVWDRMVPSTFITNVNLKVSFVIDESLGGENAVVKVADGKAEVRGARFRAVVAGAGVLLRAMKFSAKNFELDDGEYRFEPKMKYREVYFARHYDNWYHRASVDEFIRYFEDLMLWGMNAVHDPIAYPIVDASKAKESDRVAYLASSKALGIRAIELDVDLSVRGGGNKGPRNLPSKYRSLHHYKGKGSTVFNVCPARPGAMEYLKNLHRDACEQRKGFEYTACRYGPYDEGGCHCGDCYPWGGNGYVKLIEEMRDINEKYKPGLKHIVSTWFFDREDWKLFYEYLEKQDWIDYIMVGHAGSPSVGGIIPKYIVDNPIPKNIPVITFPEISMYGRFPWGGTGANPLPKKFEQLCRAQEKVSMGFSMYSEGIYEDLNKIIINSLSVDPSRTTDSVLAEYANWELPGADPAEFVKLTKMLEDIYLMRIKGRRGITAVSVAAYLKDAPKAELDRRAVVATDALDLANKINGDILPRCRTNWRWRQIYLRTVIDAANYRTRDVRNPESMAAYGELITMYHAERQVTELYEGTWGGFTAPPMMESARIRKAWSEYLDGENKK